jgi:hypothetical protein
MKFSNNKLTVHIANNEFMNPVRTYIEHIEFIVCYMKTNKHIFT